MSSAQKHTLSQTKSKLDYEVRRVKYVVGTVVGGNVYLRIYSKGAAARMALTHTLKLSTLFAFVESRAPTPSAGVAHQIR